MPAAAAPPSSMLSGPDLGGGFLHQLSFESGGEAPSFVFHAQDGGADAGGPPAGPLDALGYVHPDMPCMYGGPRCWHRRFGLALAEAPRVRVAYNRSRFTMEATMGQLYRGKAIAVAEALAEVVDRIAGPLASAGIEWYVAGSTAAWLEGAPCTPHDIDLGTTRDGVDRIAAALQPYLIEPLAPTDWPPGRIVRGARAFVGTLQDGARVEWAVPIDGRAPLPLEEFSGEAGIARLRPVEFRSETLLASRPEYGLLRAASRGRAEGERMWTDLVQRVGADPELLEILLARSGLPAERVAGLRAEVLGDPE